MKPGDIIEWKGANRIYQGRVTESEDGGLLVQMDETHSFHLDDLLLSKSLKVCSMSE